jgi:hypothetical protein
MAHLFDPRRVLDRAGGSSRNRQPAKGPTGLVGIGFAAGVATAGGVILGRKVVTTAKIGKGHPLKHRVLDMRPAPCSRNIR